MPHHIHHEVLLAASAEQVYAALTDATQFSALSGGAPAQIDATTGGAFSCFGGMIVGRNIECTPGERLVQAWRSKTWPAGLYSVARFELRAEGDKTRIVFDHTGFPEDQGTHLDGGWHSNYWEPLEKRFG